MHYNPTFIPARLIDLNIDNAMQEKLISLLKAQKRLAVIVSVSSYFVWKLSNILPKAGYFKPSQSNYYVTT